MRRVLPANVYDALQLSAEMYGGIGAGRAYVGGVMVPPGHPTGKEVPVCIHGHGWRAGFVGDQRVGWGISFVASDDAVRAINLRYGVANRDARVSFEEWCAELGVVRGPGEAVTRDELQPSEARLPARPSHD